MFWAQRGFPTGEVEDASALLLHRPEHHSRGRHIVTRVKVVIGLALIEPVRTGAPFVIHHHCCSGGGIRAATMRILNMHASTLLASDRREATTQHEPRQSGILSDAYYRLAQTSLDV